ncbi:MAG: MFS transporter [Halieaceae bacterium]|jgi:MFS family permease|nr:MFS transporter [Halieaceae bacterium]
MIASRLAQKLPFHFGWIIAITASAVIFACLGMARFGLGMLLPSMGDDLSLSYSQMGYISSGNFAGYLLSVALVPYSLKIFGARKVIVFGLFLIATTTVAMSQMQGFPAAVIVYLFTGMGSGFANIPVMALLSHWFSSQYRGRAAGIAVVGSSFAIMASGLSVPEINQNFGASGWRIGWGSIGGLSAFIALLCWLILRDSPKDLGLQAVGEKGTNGTIKEPLSDTSPPKLLNGLMLNIGVIYFAFGATYMTYGTFIITTLINEFGYSENVAGGLWFWIGFLSLFSGLIFGPLSDKLGRKATIIIVYTIQTGAYGLAAVASSGWVLYLSLGLYGIAVFSVPAVISAMMGDYLGPKRAAAGLSFVTFFFAAGQVIGPASAGMTADIFGSFTPAYGFSALVTALAVVATIMLKPPPDSDAPHNLDGNGV